MTSQLLTHYYLQKISITKFRNGLKHTIPINTSLKVFNYLTLSPSINFTERWYFSRIKKIGMAIVS